jgi:hypothetical protein
MADLQELERRVQAFEAAQNDTTQTLRWVVARLGKVSAVQDEHSLRLERIETDVSGFRREFNSFQSGQASMIADVMREVLKEGKP